MSEQAKHTPGPWGLAGEAYERVSGVPAGSEQPFIFVEADGYEAGGGVCLVHNKPRGVGTANTRLIIAAPDLLAACVRFRAMTSRTSRAECDGACEQMDAAISKARGVEGSPA